MTPSNLHFKIKSMIMGKVGLVYDAIAISELMKIDMPYLPWTGAALRPSAIKIILNDIIVNNRKNILELGGGVSTYYLAKFANENGLNVFTVEHDLEWIKFLKKSLKKLNLDQNITFIHAPLVPYEQSKKHSTLWYEPEKIFKTLNNSAVDMLIVDGPIAEDKNNNMARYPALPLLKSYLSTDAIVILDDIHREAESKIIDRWALETGISFSLSIAKGGIAIGIQGKSYFSGL
jgi:predicted O-methyltransferase YrrM